MRTLLIALALALLQTPAPPGSIEGIVLGPDGGPIKGADVYAIAVPARLAVPRQGRQATVKASSDF